MKKRQKSSAVVKTVLFILVMSSTFALGWFFIGTFNQASVSDSSNPSAAEEVGSNVSGESTAADEEWDRIQAWIEDNEVQINENRIPETTHHLDIIRTYKGVGDYEVGVGGFAGEEDDLTVSWELERPQDRLNIRVTNTTSDYFPLIIKLFYNYESVDFRVVGADTYENELLINLPPGYEYIIPFHLDPALEAHAGYSKLTMAVFFDPDEYSVFHGWGHDMAATALNFEMNHGSNQPPPLDQVQHPFEVRLDLDNRGGLFLGQPGSITPEDFLGPGRPRQASPGELLDIEVLVSGLGEIWSDTGERELVEDFLIVGLLDFKQIPLSGRPFLWSAYDAVPLFGHFTIEAPMEPGLYDFVALFVTNPTGRTTLNNFVPIDMSMRFTIEVMEE